MLPVTRLSGYCSAVAKSSAAHVDGSRLAETCSRPLPAWYDDAKLGMMVCWGPYSVPGWAPLTGELAQIAANEGFETFDSLMNPVFGGRELTTYENELRIQFIVKNDMSISLRGRHYRNTKK